MNVTPGVDLAENLEGPLHDIECECKGDPAAEAVHIFLAGHAFQVFFDKIKGAVFLKGINEARNARHVGKEVQHISLPAHLHETPGELLLSGESGSVRNGLRLGPARYIICVVAQNGGETVHMLGSEFFDGDFGAGDLVVCQIDGTESAGAQNGPEAVAVLKKACILAHCCPPERVYRYEDKIPYVYYSIIWRVNWKFRGKKGRA